MADRDLDDLHVFEVSQRVDFSRQDYSSSIYPGSLIHRICGNILVGAVYIRSWKYRGTSAGFGRIDYVIESIQLYKDVQE